jgi:hypothetical protein
MMVFVCEDRGRMYLSFIFLNLNVPHFLPLCGIRWLNPDEKKDVRVR